MKLSIITIAYNNLLGLQNTHSSIGIQNFRDYEWIVVDGGSKDGTYEYLSNLKPCPARWVSEPDNGVYDAMNKGLSMARGDYVMFLNSGDRLSGPLSLQKLFIPDPQTDVVFGDLNFVYSTGFQRRSYEYPITLENLVKTGVPHPASIIRRPVIVSYGGYDTTLGIVSDWKMWLKFFLDGRTFEHRSEVITDFDANGMSSTRIGQIDAERTKVARELFGVAAKAHKHPHDAVIVIPVYRKDLLEREILSLRRCMEVLGRYKIVLCCPKDLDISEYNRIAGKNLPCERFDKSYFEGLSGYNRLMLNPDFYRRFSMHEYLLIYQLDAWVFADELCQWMDKGYDYIGAPWYDRYLSHECGCSLFATGNGGFSLRRIKPFIAAIESDLPIKTMTERRMSEDGVFTVGLANTPYALRTPDPVIAARFAFEKSPTYLKELLCNQMPFGCHAWEKFEFDKFWRQYIPYRLTAKDLESALAVKNYEKDAVIDEWQKLEAEYKILLSQLPARRHLRSRLKLAFPYGFMCYWLKVRYGETIDRPLFYYGFGLKGLKRIFKFASPFGMVMKWRQQKYGE